MAAFIKTADHLTVVFDNGESATVYPSNPKYKDIVAALSAKDYAKVRILSIPVAGIKDKVAIVTRRTGALVEFKNGQVYYNGEVIHNTLTDRIVEMANDGFDIEPMTKFLENLKTNPSFRAVNELYRFMEKGNLPVTDDGYFLAYKKVDENYLDCYTHTISNKVGEVVTMERNLVDEDKSRECSSGLHFCSKGYLANFSGSHTMIVKINPADVVAIPEDYDSAKGRCCRYEVIGEINGDQGLEGAFRPSANYVEPTVEEDVCAFCGEADCSAEDDYGYDDEEEDVLEQEGEYIDTQFAERADGSIVLTLAGELVKDEIQMIDIESGDVLVTYLSLKEAADDNGIAASAIRRVLKGERNTTGGYAWKLVIPTVDVTNAHTENLAQQHEHGTLKGGKPHVVGPHDNFINVANASDEWPFDEDDEDEDRPY